MVSEILPWSILSYVVTFIIGGLVGARVATSFYKTFRSGRSRRRGRYGRRWDDGYEADEEEDRGSAVLDRLIGVGVFLFLGWTVYNYVASPAQPSIPLPANHETIYKEVDAHNARRRHPNTVPSVDTTPVQKNKEIYSPEFEKPDAGSDAAYVEIEESSETYWIQVGAFSKHPGAEKKAQEIQNLGLPVQIVEADLFYVFVGPFATRKEAEQVNTGASLKGSIKPGQ